MTWRLECLLCGAQAGFATEGENVAKSAIGSHLIDVHHWTVPQVDALEIGRRLTGDLVPALGVLHLNPPGQPDVMLAHEVGA
jgi:hypothetical protein